MACEILLATGLTQGSVGDPGQGRARGQACQAPVGSLEPYEWGAGWYLVEKSHKVQIPDWEQELGWTSLEQGLGAPEPFSQGSGPVCLPSSLPARGFSPLWLRMAPGRPLLGAVLC